MQDRRMERYGRRRRRVTDGRRVSTLLWGSTGVTFQLHPVPNLLLLEHTRCPPTQSEDTHTHSGTHSHRGIRAGEKIPWKIPESWAFKSLEASSCFKAKWAAFMLCVAPAWIASMLQVADKAGLKTPHVSENQSMHWDIDFIVWWLCVLLCGLTLCILK